MLYYIHVSSAEGMTFDETGVDFSSFEQAKSGAVDAATAVLCDELKGCLDSTYVIVHLEDANRNPVLTIPITAKLVR